MFFSLKIALSSLRAHRLRTLLAMAGVFFGALALTGVQHVSLAMHARAEYETAKLGTNLFTARTGQVSFRRSGSARVRNEAKTLTLQDAAALMDSLPAARLGAPFVSREMKIRAGDTKIPCQLIATTPAYREIRNAFVRFGRFLTREDEKRRAKVCVLGAKIAERLFGDPKAALGAQVFLFRAGLRVAGVMEYKGADIVGADQDEHVFVPISTYMRRLSNQNWISGIYIRLADSGAYATTREAARQILRRRHHIGVEEKEDFSLLTAQDAMQLQQQALDLVQTLGWISSSVSFAVGGLGIFSIMVLLVRIRRLEIGVRRAVGAKRRDIIRQFIFEAGLMASVGGALGVLCGAALVFLVYRFGQMPVIYDPLLILGTLAGSVLLGLAAGVYPAWQASRIEGLELLRTG